jgi:hypothetical protein
MPFQPGKNLKSGEAASKLGHLEVLESELVNELIENFESPDIPIDGSKVKAQPLPETDHKHDIIFAVDGSLQIVNSELIRYKELSFIKTALLRLNRSMVEKIDPESPHPLALKKLMEDSALFHATVFPLKNVFIPGASLYDSVRQIIFESLKDEKLKGEVMETLKWLSYGKWDPESRQRSPSFECPKCEEEINLPFDAEQGKCFHCGAKVYLSDMLGFHLDMAEDSAPSGVASAYMLVHEILLLFTGIRHYFDRGKYDLLSRCLFIKDGPLSTRGQYVKLTQAIRAFFEYAKQKEVQINLVGQEKTGTFVDHLQLIRDLMPEYSYFIPSNEYIRKEVQRRDAVTDYGFRTNFGNKVFVKLDRYHSMVLSIPTGSYIKDVTKDQLIGFDDILSSLKSLRSYRFEGALVPVELANGIASLSTYPSARILKMFAGF